MLFGDEDGAEGEDEDDDPEEELPDEAASPLDSFFDADPFEEPELPDDAPARLSVR